MQIRRRLLMPCIVALGAFLVTGFAHSGPPPPQRPSDLMNIVDDPDPLDDCLPVLDWHDSALRNELRPVPDSMGQCRELRPEMFRPVAGPGQTKTLLLGDGWPFRDAGRIPSARVPRE